MGKIVYNDNTNVMSEDLLYQTFAEILVSIANEVNEEDNNETDDRIS